jgi:hypothetical protein
MGNNSSQEVREFPSHDLARRDQPLPIMVTANQRTVAAKATGFCHGVSSMLSLEVSEYTVYLSVCQNEASCMFLSIEGLPTLLPGAKGRARKAGQIMLLSSSILEVLVVV